MKTTVRHLSKTDSSRDGQLISIKLFDEAAVFDFFQNQWIDEVARVEIFHLRPGFGELIDDGLNAFAVRIRGPGESSPHQMDIPPRANLKLNNGGVLPDSMPGFKT